MTSTNLEDRLFNDMDNIARMAEGGLNDLASGDIDGAESTLREIRDRATWED